MGQQVVDAGALRRRRGTPHQRVRHALPSPRADASRRAPPLRSPRLPMRLWLWLTTAIVTKEWVACHRKHHAFADREGDPHSPLVEGLRNIVLKGAFYYRKAVRQPGMLEKYGKGTPNDWLERHLLTPLNWIGHARDARHRRLPVRLLRRPARVGRPDDLDSVLGRRRHQRHRPRARLSQLRGEGREPEHLAPSPSGSAARSSTTTTTPTRRAPSSRRSWFEFDIGWIYIRALKLIGLAKIEYARNYGSDAKRRDEHAVETVAA